MNNLEKHFEFFYKEDGLDKNQVYFQQLPTEPIECHLKLKSPMILSGLPFFVESFNYLKPNILNYDHFKEYEGYFFESFQIDFKLPFNVALTGERIALNLLQRASSISTYTNSFASLAKERGIKILDTRKTTPGLRFLEKYAVQKGGGFNHRLDQNDAFMIKDNHKTKFGGLAEAVKFFKSLNSFYTPLIAEIHSLEELEQAVELGITHVMLDNFEPAQIQEALKLKVYGMTFEVSGGIRLDTITDYLIKGIDALSVGVITYGAPPVDISMKMETLQ